MLRSSLLVWITCYYLIYVIALHQKWRLCLCLIRTGTIVSDAKEKSLSDPGSATLNLAWRTCNFQSYQSGVIPAIAAVIS